MARASSGLGGRGGVRLNRIHRRRLHWQWCVAGQGEPRQRDVDVQRRYVAEELAFARKASGLNRGLSMWDAFGADLTSAPIVSVGLAAVGFPLAWGALGGSMPRSGGERVFWRHDAMQGPAVTYSELPPE
jgi:hypothetical protein